jgi:hypothetical protein
LIGKRPRKNEKGWLEWDETLNENVRWYGGRGMLTKRCVRTPTIQLLHSTMYNKYIAQNTYRVRKTARCSLEKEEEINMDTEHGRIRKGGCGGQ